MTKKAARVLTNTNWLDSSAWPDGQLSVTRLGEGRDRWRGVLWSLICGRFHGVFFNIESAGLLLVCTAKKFLPWVRTKVLSVDLILNRPEPGLRRIRFLLLRWLLEGVDRFVFYYKDTSELRRLYRISQDRVGYVPFKVNTREQLQSMTTHDEKFFLSCGRSNRDYQTLCDAFRALPYRCVILVALGESREHGTDFDGATLPPNVELVSDDGSPASWNGWIARARAVVLPILGGRLSPAGVSTYLVAMALGKCVVITRSNATEGILTDTEAVLVPPDDWRALRAAIVRVAEDGEFRAEIAAGGQRYALSLGGEERLKRDLIIEFRSLLGTRNPTTK